MPDPGKSAQVFIVEDSDADVFLVEEALRSEGIDARIQRCQDGEEAVRTLSTIADPVIPDIIIIDLNLPKVTGFDILKHVRGLQQLDRVPVLILTSSASTADRSLALRLGANGYIPKPPTLPEFLKTVGSGISGLLQPRDQGAGARKCSPTRPNLWRRPAHAVLCGRATMPRGRVRSRR
jgi:DNA-binding response OmpR family regulator